MTDDIYGEYHARDWAMGRDASEIGRLAVSKNRNHHWNTVGNANLDYIRRKTLQLILTERSTDGN